MLCTYIEKLYVQMRYTYTGIMYDIHVILKCIFPWQNTILCLRRKRKQLLARCQRQMALSSNYFVAFNECTLFTCFAHFVTVLTCIRFIDANGDPRTLFTVFPVTNYNYFKSFTFCRVNDKTNKLPKSVSNFFCQVTSMDKVVEVTRPRCFYNVFGGAAGRTMGRRASQTYCFS